MTVMLSRSASGRDNNFNLIRFLAAALVLYSHAYPLSGTLGEPLEKLAGFSLGHFAVDVFFAVSGFLVTGSLLGKRRLGPFLRARVLRIFPALLASSVLTAFVVGALHTRLPLLAYLRDVDTWRFALQNTTCWPWPIVYGLPGVFEHLPVAAVVNGSLWSLPFELNMYAGLAITGLLAYTGPRLLGDRLLRALVIAGAILAVLAYTANETFEFANGFTTRQGIRLSALFATGAAFYVLRERVPLARAWFAAALAGLAAALVWGHAAAVLYTVSLQYVVLWLACVPKGLVRKYNALGDYSYGFYLWAFPMQQTVMTLRPGSSRLALTVLAGLPTLALAVLSWHLLESPMLALKDRWAGPRPPVAPVAAAEAAPETPPEAPPEAPPANDSSQHPDAAPDNPGAGGGAMR
jgi:peptidoglycan/LPS O-acetylase OafA/YrhL